MDDDRADRDQVHPLRAYFEQLMIFPHHIVIAAAHFHKAVRRDRNCGDADEGENAKDDEN